MLKAMLTSEMEEATSKRINMEEFSNDTVEYFLEYLYKGTLELYTDDSSCLVHLWVMGDKYDILGLVELVESLQMDCSRVENVMDIYLDANTFEVVPLRDTCLALISKKKK